MNSPEGVKPVTPVVTQPRTEAVNKDKNVTERTNELKPAIPSLQQPTTDKKIAVTAIQERKVAEDTHQKGVEILVQEEKPPPIEIKVKEIKAVPIPQGLKLQEIEDLAKKNDGTSSTQEILS